MTYALDTNIVSYLLREDAALTSKVAAEIANGHEITIPPIVYYEIKRWLNIAGATKKERLFRQLCVGADMTIYESDLDQAALIYANLKRQGKPTSDADILIAAFCIATNSILITNNEKHFAQIEDLEWLNWIED